jgi:hypothetical protein
MKQTRKQIECLNRLDSLNGAISDILEFLFQEALVNKEVIKMVRSGPDKGKSLEQILAGLSAQGKLQLLEYEWSVLPLERIKVLIITDKATKNFEFGY